MTKDAKLRLQRASFLEIQKWKDSGFYNDPFQTSVHAVCNSLHFLEKGCCYVAEGHQSCLQHQPILSYKKSGRDKDHITYKESHSNGGRELRSVRVYLSIKELQALPGS